MVFSRFLIKYGTRLNRAVMGMASRKAINLAGDRDIEWSWIASHIPSGPGYALDFGAGTGCLGLVAAQRGFKVTAVDLEPVIWQYAHPALEFIQGDILNVILPVNYYDLVINCSTVEHVGLAGRYSVTENNPDGDLQAIYALKNNTIISGHRRWRAALEADSKSVPVIRVSYGIVPFWLVRRIIKNEQIKYTEGRS